MSQCSSLCVKAQSFEFPRRENLAVLSVADVSTGHPTACTVCEQRAKIVCIHCYCTAYCSRGCLLIDYIRHDSDCEWHSPRLWAYRRFERLSTQAVRFKHTGVKSKGVGMFARRPFSPGDRVLEDCVQFTAESIKKANESRDYSDFGPMENYVQTIYGDLTKEGGATFSLHSGQIMALTGGYQGSWSTFINHSCFPNCVMMVSDCKHFLLVTAIRAIAQGEEITVSYTGASCAPLSIRTPLLKRLLGTPCVCISCSDANSTEEHARRVIWEVIQHSRGAYTSELFKITRGMRARDVIHIADNILDIARTLLGSSQRFSEQWLAVVECTVCTFAQDACKVIKSPQLRAYAKKVQQHAKETSSYVGVCARLLIK